MPTPDDLDQATISLIFALRDSLTDVSRLDFWTDRCRTAIETAAAGSETAAHAVTTAARKLQIATLTKDAGTAAVAAAQVIDADYQAWAGHVARNLVYIIALARIENDQKKTRKAAQAALDMEAPF